MQLQYNTTEFKPTNFRNVPVKADELLVLVLVDLQSQIEDMRDSKCVQLCCILTKASEKKTFATISKGSQCTIDKECITCLH